MPRDSAPIVQVQGAVRSPVGQSDGVPAPGPPPQSLPGSLLVLGQERTGGRVVPAGNQVARLIGGHGGMLARHQEAQGPTGTFDYLDPADPTRYTRPLESTAMSPK
jgi:hypothetical protein